MVIDRHIWAEFSFGCLTFELLDDYPIMEIIVDEVALGRHIEIVNVASQTMLFITQEVHLLEIKFLVVFIIPILYYQTNNIKKISHLF